MVQNLESLGLSGRVYSTEILLIIFVPIVSKKLRMFRMFNSSQVSFLPKRAFVALNDR